MVNAYKQKDFTVVPVVTLAPPPLCDISRINEEGEGLGYYDNCNQANLWLQNHVQHLRQEVRGLSIE